MAWTINADDSITGADGYLTFTLDGKSYIAGNVKKFKATTEASSTSFKVLGSRSEKTKMGTIKGTWSAEGFVCDSRFKKEWIRWINGERSFPVLTFTASNTHSSRGTETVVIKNCNVSKFDIINLDAEADVLSETLEGTFDGVSMTKAFKNYIPEV